MGFRLVPQSVTLNDFETLNSVMALISCHLTEFGSFRGLLCNWL